MISAISSFIKVSVNFFVKETKRSQFKFLLFKTRKWVSYPQPFFYTRISVIVILTIGSNNAFLFSSLASHNEAWVTSALDDNDVIKVLVLAQSLRKVGTAKRLALITGPNLSDDKR